MSLVLTQNAKALSPNLKTYFMASGGIAPYTYSVLIGGISGTIDPSSGEYIAPSVFGMDTIRATDSTPITPLTVDLPISVLNHLELVCDIIQTSMGLSTGQVYLWDQKYNIPNDSKMYIAVGILSCKPFSNSNKFDGSNDIQSTNFLATLSIDIFSRNLEALNRKEEIVMALRSTYSLKQQDANSFSLAKIPSAFVNVSYEEGVSMLYRFNISVNMVYSITKTIAPEYYDNFSTVSVLTNE